MDIETLLQEKTELENKIAKNQKALDKVLAENEELKAQIKNDSNLKAEFERAQREARLEELRAFKAETLAKDRYRMQGMSEDLVQAAAFYEMNNDMDGLARIQAQHRDKLVNEARNKWSKNNSSVAVTTPTLTQAQFDNMSLQEKSELYRTNQDLYNQFI